MATPSGNKTNRGKKAQLNDQTAQPFITEFGKLPPQAVDLEEAVLGACMIEREAFDKVAEIINADAFYKDAHQIIFRSFIELSNRIQPIDIMTVTQELRRMGQLEAVGGPFAITQLTNRVGSAAHVEYHARVISQKHIQRELIRVSTDIQREAYKDENDVFELLDEAEKQLFSIAEGNITKNYASIDDLLVRAIKHIESIKDHKDGLSGVPSGFSQLDRITSGWQNNALIIIAARPGMGKTAFALSAARNAAVLGGKSVAVFSLEMESVELVTRLIASEAQIPGEKLKNGKLEPYEWEQLNHKVTQLNNSKIYIDDTPALSMFQLRAKTRRLKAQYGIDLVVVDYLQLMKADDSSKAGNREQEISYISRSLKALAKELGIPIIALAQLNRDTEKRGGSKIPALSDIRESGSIEQDADIVLFIHRPEYYGVTETIDGQSTRGLAQIIISKHRNGATGDAWVRFRHEFASFSNLEIGEVHSYAEKEEMPEISMDQNITITKASRMNDFEDEAPF